MSTGETIQTRISRRLGMEIDAATKRSGKTRSAILREAIEQFLSDARLSEQIKKQHTDTIARISALEKMTGDAADNVTAMFDYLRSA